MEMKSFSIMDVRGESSTFVQNERGQSSIELLFFVPFLLGISTLLFKANSAIQVSLVHQKYARAQALFLAYNSPIYPERRFRTGDVLSTVGDQFTVGVSQNIVTNAQAHEPVAAVIQVSRLGKPQSELGNDQPGLEPPERGRVRIRTSVGPCRP